MKSDLDIDLLRSFVAVAETRHFTRAAESLNCAQSAVSMQVKRLERIVGATLFERSKRMVKLTADGEAFRRYANRMLRLNDQTLAAFGKNTLQGRVRLSATDTSMCFLPRILSRFAQSCPLVELEIRCDRSWESLDALQAGEVDLSLVTQAGGRTGGTLVKREALVWAAARGGSADEVDPLPLAIFGPGCNYREAALKALDACGLRWRHAYNSESRDGLNVAVAAGLAVTIVPVSSLGNDLRVLGADQGFPQLPDIEILLFEATSEPAMPVATLAKVIADTLGDDLPTGV
ncbi:LysR family transcriptional regulator [Pelagibius sp. Alg239-R121]|uniref:LysR family transcriptional regulator n=1 Tax=Pelagibius sp. Alg239-R121 TaxID=2993448 RepID=UPI0024A6A31B|nr:LysR family transcriptional regulator [Pelagibius sp. Alg239-R121]